MNMVKVRMKGDLNVDEAPEDLDIPDELEAGKTYEVPEKYKEVFLKEGAELVEETPEVKLEALEGEEKEISKNKNKKIHVLYDKLGWGETEKKEFLKKKAGVEHTNELTDKKASGVIDDLERRLGDSVHESKTEAGGQEAGLMMKPKAKERKAPTLYSVEDVKSYIDRAMRIVDEVIDKKPTQRGGDVMYINKKGEGTTNPDSAVNTHITRSGLRKLALAGGFDMETLEREKISSEDSKGEYYVWVYTVKVTDPSGRHKISDGACSSRDKFFTKGGKTEPDEADIMHKAETVAYNRGILDLIGAPNLPRGSGY